MGGETASLGEGQGWAVVCTPERRAHESDYFFWVQLASLWERLAEFSHEHQSEYLSKAKDCMEKARLMKSKILEGDDTHGA